jgi:hypothetical protein
VHTELRVERNKTGQHRHSADRSVIDLVSAVIRKAAMFSSSRTRVATVSNFWYMTEAAYGFVRRS